MYVCTYVCICSSTYVRVLPIYPCIQPASQPAILLPILRFTFTIFEWKNGMKFFPGKKKIKPDLVDFYDKEDWYCQFHSMLDVFHNLNKLDQVVQYLEEIFLKHLYSMFKMHLLKNTSS